MKKYYYKTKDGKGLVDGISHKLHDENLIEITEEECEELRDLRVRKGIK